EVERWLADYCCPERFSALCEACPNYGQVWSCPPGVPPARDAFAPYGSACVIAVKVIYDEETRAAAVTPEETARLRRESYEKVKRALWEGLLEREAAHPGTYTVAAGRCEACAVCARQEKLPCRAPEKRRYSFSAFGFDLTPMAEELLGVKLLWAKTGLPEYDVAMAAVLT
ncbi:MAG: DUF2284 domain-containing protein, partial [Pseudoflavonifractor sp.]